MKILPCVLLTLCCLVNVPAQERVMDKTEFESLVSDAQKHRLIWKDEKYRMTVTTSSKAVGRPQTDWSSKIIVEYGPGTDNRSISSSVFGDKVNPTEEALRIGNWVYRRSGDKPWTRKEYAAPKAPERPESPVQVLETDSQYKYVGPGLLGDKPVQIYVKTERQTKVGNKSGDSMQTDIKVTYWIDTNGTLLKSEFAAETRGSNVTSQTQVVTLWERDASISFVEPAIAP
jgi:hypothetical protein